MAGLTVLTPEQYDALGAAGFRIGPSSVVPINDHGVAYTDLFRVETVDHQVYALKVRSTSATHVQVALSVLKTVHDPGGLLEQYVAAIPAAGHVLLLTKWIPGTTARETPKHLPQLFRRLARLHADNPWTGQVTTKYVDGKPFDTTEGMVRAEVSSLLTDLPSDMEQDRVAEALQPLDCGLTCVTHDDVNPGNIMVYRNTPVLIDCEWVHGGLNLLDLEYLDLLNIHAGTWWAIQDQASACLSAYFGELGLAASEANQQTNAFLALQALRWNTYVRWRQETSSYATARALLDKSLSRHIHV